MKLINKANPNKLGEIVPYDIAGKCGIAIKTDEGVVWYYHSLAELNAEWEDVPEEPKTCWYLDCNGEPMEKSEIANYYNPAMIEIGNYFSSREEAELAVRKLKAWKRLKDKGFRLNAVVDDFFCLDIFMKGEPYEAIKDDLKIVFGGEE